MAAQLADEGAVCGTADRSFRHQHASTQADDQRRNLADDTVADGERGVESGGLANPQTVTQCSDDNATDRVDQRDDDRGDRVAPHELRGAIHRAVEGAFVFQFLPPPPGFLIGDGAG